MKKIKITLAFIMALGCSTKAQTVKLEEAINTYVDQYKFTGTVLIARKDEIILQKGYGFRDAATQATNTVNTIYEIASLAKQFTASVILKLQEQGKLCVKDKLSKYYPGYPNGDKITIHQLLSHTAGVADYVKISKFQQSDQTMPVSLDSMINLFKNIPLDFEPGSKFSYSNSGYTLLGYIIEKVTGKPYRYALENMILKPLRLTHSGYDFIALRDPNKATGYNIYADANYQPAAYVHPSILYTTGALYSTVGDLYRWHKALMKDEFLSPASKKSMYTPVIGPYGYGWFADSLFGKKRVSHDGNVAGFKSNINCLLDDDICVIALSNSNSSRVGEMVRVLVSILYDRPYLLPVERKSIQLDESQQESIAGTYQFSPTVSLKVTLENGKLFIQGSGLSKVEIFSESATAFFAKSMDLKIELEQDQKTGVVSQMFFYWNKQKLLGKKIN